MTNDPLSNLSDSQVFGIVHRRRISETIVGLVLYFGVRFLLPSLLGKVFAWLFILYSTVTTASALIPIGAHLTILGMYLWNYREPSMEPSLRKALNRWTHGAVMATTVGTAVLVYLSIMLLRTMYG